MKSVYMHVEYHTSKLSFNLHVHVEEGILWYRDGIKMRGTRQGRMGHGMALESYTH